MENVSHLDQTIHLGEKIVRELDLADSCNTFGRWAAHYLAENIIASETAKSIKKQKLHKEKAQEVAKLLQVHLTPDLPRSSISPIKINIQVVDASLPFPENW